jgi:stage II sporulation protein D
VPAANANLKRAIRETAGVCVIWKKDVVKTYFSSSCGGHTMGVKEWTGGADVPPLSGVTCGFCEGVPNGRWTAKTTLAELTRKLKSRTGERPLARVSVAKLTESGRVAEVLLEARDGKRIEVAGDAFVDACGGRNRMFAIKLDGESLVLEGKGYGHGVGMCQYGAIGMAQKGKSWEEILAHYFPQATIAPVYGPALKKARP